MNRFTVEETNLISIYIADTRRELIGEMTGALPYMDGEMRELALRTLAKLRAMSDADFAVLAVSAADEEPQSERPYQENLLQLYGRELHFAGRWGRVRLSAAHFLFASLQMVSKRRTSRRQAALRGDLPSRGQAAVRRVRHGVCVHLKQCQILPRLPQADHPQASRREDAETTRPRYAVGAKKPLRHAAFQTRFEHDRGIIPKPAKTVFYCVTDP